MHSRIELVPVSRLVPSRWTREETHEDLVESFTSGAQTQLQNIVCRLLEDGKLEVLAGARRLAAARQMGWSHLEVKVLECSDEKAELVFWEENVRRKGLKGEMGAQAIARLKQLIDPDAHRGGDRRSRAFKESNGQNGQMNVVAQLAKITGKSERQVRRLVAIGNGGTTARDPREIISDRLRQALRLAARCLNELGYLDHEHRTEMQKLLDACQVALVAASNERRSNSRRTHQ